LTPTPRLWSNARMRLVHDNWVERIAADVLNRGLPRIMAVRWQDEDIGWRSMQVIASSQEEARRIVEPIAGAAELQVHAL
jgi:hypothetical protein